MAEEEVVGSTESVCPECLRVVPANKVMVGDAVYLVKKCAEHGTFRVLIWDGEPAYADWGVDRIPATIENPVTLVENGCPFDCGLCPEHRQETCCVLLEVTADCNLNCPICFASSQQRTGSDPSLNEIRAWYGWLALHGGPYNIQISGGEPTVRDDLPEIVRLGREAGFTYLQLNSNGLRLAREPEFVRTLREAGLNSVFLQFDGTNDEIYKIIRGRALFREKMAAIENCARAGLGVILVPTLVPGVNMDNLGAIIDLAINGMPHIRGVHFQPISYFGRYPGAPPEKRVTVPEILRAVEQRTDGRIKADHFIPAGAENSYCTFHGNFTLTPDGKLKPWSSFRDYKASMKPVNPRVEIQKARSFVSRQWSAPPKSGKCNCTKLSTLDFDQILERIQGHTLCISGMAFQDAWTLDLDRLRDCKLHVFHPDGKLIPFCAYNLTARNGRSIYRSSITR